MVSKRYSEQAFNTRGREGGQLGLRTREATSSDRRRVTKDTDMLKAVIT